MHKGSLTHIFSICKCQNGHSQIVAFGTNQGTFLLSLLLSAYWDKAWRPSSDPHMSCRPGSSLWCFLSSLEVWYSEKEEWGRLSDISSKEIFVSAFHNIIKTGCLRSLNLHQVLYLPYLVPNRLAARYVSECPSPALVLRRVLVLPGVGSVRLCLSKSPASWVVFYFLLDFHNLKIVV